ncbi:MAG TPA: response regulator [Mariprofundaceae bacterium]|nr:response regulator [Mariprofundaceae bacterium]
MSRLELSAPGFEKHSMLYYLRHYPAEIAMPTWRREMLLSALVLGIPIIALFAINHYLVGHLWLSYLQFAVAVILVPCLIATRKGILVNTSKNIMLAAATVMFLAVLADGGIARSGIFWMSMFPFLAFMIAGCKPGLYWILLFMAGLLGLFVVSELDLFNLVYQPLEITYFFLSFQVFTMLAFAFALVHERDRFDLQLTNQELIESQRQLELIKADLETMVAERTARLSDANRQLRTEVTEKKQAIVELEAMQKNFMQAQKMEAIGTLVGGIAHDFNNMLSGITANLYMLQHKVQDEEIKKRLERIDKLVMHAADMIRQMLTFARKDNITLSRFELKSFIKEAFKLARLSIPAEVRTQLNYPPEGEMCINGEATQLQQVLMNLMNNARDALEGVENPLITVELSDYIPDGHFRMKYPDKDAPHYALLTIRDNGTGIPAEQQHRIFEPFFTTKEEGKGTGLGLAMTYGAVQSHNGVIEVESIPKLGTSFHIYLPLTKTETETASEETATDTAMPQGNGETILLVDDDEYLRESTRELLEQMNYRIIEAGNGREAVAIFQQRSQEIDLTIMDIAMPEMGGVRASKMIREFDPDAHVIFITGYDKYNTLGQSVISDWNDLVYKPLNIASLGKAIQKHLRPA